jgi:hypothetical protein
MEHKKQHCANALNHLLFPSRERITHLLEMCTAELEGK